MEFNIEKTEMNVVKRDSSVEIMSFDKILNRVRKLCLENNIHINYQNLVIKIVDQLYDGIQTKKIDELMAQQCASMCTIHSDYGKLASATVISNHQKNTDSDILKVVSKLYNFKNFKGEHKPLISHEYYNFVSKHSEILNLMIVHQRDYLIDYFGFKTLEKSYLFKVNDVAIERPQHLWMRVAIEIHMRSEQNVFELIKESYDLMSQKYFTHATPTLFNSGTNKKQMSSCFLLSIEEDSLDGIFHTVHECATISKHSGGVGLHVHNVRAKNSHIVGTNGKASGIIPMLKVFNSTARYIDQGGGKRNGSFVIYIEPWHADVEDFLELKKNHGDEEMKARDLFYALWMPDLFMEKVETDGTWCLFCPNECPNLSNVYGEEFRELYNKYEKEQKYRKIINARDLWLKILDSQQETGTPYILYKDACNKKSNQKNIGTIKSSNLCCEIIEYSDGNESAVCNLASIGLPSFVDPINKTFDFNMLIKTTKIITNNLDKIIDLNYYPNEKTKLSNFKNRPIGIGVQGLADVFALMDVSFDSEFAKQLNKKIFETIYYAALCQSNELAIERGSYSNFNGSPASNGILQFDMWNVSPSPDFDWDTLKSKIIKNGLRNSLLVALMPTASTSQIFGFNECFEPFTSNIYTRRTLAGEFIVINKYLMKELIDSNQWSEEVKLNIIENKGSVRNLPFLSEHMKSKYRTVWEIPMKSLIDMSRDRGAFVCQSQSLNLWLSDPNYQKLTNMHLYSWKQGLKTGIYYLRRRAKHQAQQFTVAPKKNYNNSEEICESCLA